MRKNNKPKLYLMTLEDKILNYLEKINKPISVGALAKALNFKHSTVNSAVKRLVGKKFVIWEPYRSVELVAAGKKEAQHFKLHEHLVALFLMDVLNLTEEFAHEEARKIANVISCDLIERICEAYSHPNQCVCGEILPNGFLHDH